MSTFFGFEPETKPGKHLFISYSRFDSDRVANIAMYMKDKYPVWYDRGLTMGVDWEATILEHIETCRAVVIFLTSDMFAREDCYVRKEFDFAQEYFKPVYFVWLDDPNDIIVTEASDKMQFWISKIKKIQGLVLSNNIADEENAKKIISEINRSIDRKQREASFRKMRSKSSTYIKGLIILLVALFAIVFLLYVASVVLKKEYGSENEKNDGSNDNNQKQVDLLPLSEMSKSSITIGSSFTLGSYEQDCDENNGTEPIAWRVLYVDSEKEQALVISESLLDCISYCDCNYSNISQSHEKIDWKHSALRNWTNDYLYNSAFTASEKERIALITHHDDKNNDNNDLNSDNDTEDYIFSLDLTEANEYFSSSRDRIAFLTDYATEKANISSYDQTTGIWALRNMSSSINVSCVDKSGTVWDSIPDEYITIDRSTSSCELHTTLFIRPAMWINL